MGNKEKVIYERMVMRVAEAAKQARIIERNSLIVEALVNNMKELSFVSFSPDKELGFVIHTNKSDTQIH